MKADHCEACGKHINTASDHDILCPCYKTTAAIVGSTVLQTGAVIGGNFEMVKLRFHEDGTVTWQRLWNQ